jgi:hypothetical protein
MGFTVLVANTRCMTVASRCYITQTSHSVMIYVSADNIAVPSPRVRRSVWWEI